MRLIKLFGLASIVTLVATAFVAALPASATWTVLCKSNEGGASTCSEANSLEFKLVHLVAKDGKLLTNFGTVLCEESLFSGEALELGKPQLIHIQELKYSGCSFGGQACKVTTTHLGLLHLLKTEVDKGELLDLENGGSFTTVHVECGKSLNCEYKGENLVGAAASGNPGTVTYTETTVTKVAGGFLCPNTSKLDAVTGPHSLVHPV